MPARPTKYYRPRKIEDALALISVPGTVPLAGGTKLLAGEFDGAVVDLQDLQLNQIQPLTGKLRLGAMARLADVALYLAGKLEENDGDGKDSAAELLHKAIRLAGPNTYRNAATIGGSVAAKLADSELLATLLVLEAQVQLLSPDPESVSLPKLLEADQPPEGLITSIDLAWSAGRGASERVARTPADYPIVSVTFWRPDGGRPRLAATGIDRRPVRLYSAEQRLADGVNQESIAAAAEAAAARCRHPGDFRGDSSYRADMAAVLTKRVLRS